VLLWGDRLDDQARQSLRHTLSRLRKIVGPDVLVTEGDDVSIGKGMVECDVTRFEALMQDGSAEALRAATALYRGALLDGLSLHEEAFEAWLAQERQRLQNMAVAALTNLADKELKADQAGEALKLARRAVELDAYFETAHRCVMGALASLGQRGSALEHYRRLERWLADELNARPDDETKRLRDRIVADDGAQPSSPRGPTITDKPSIAVLPFSNLSDDPSQEYFAEGIANDVITNLSKFRSLFVIASNSSFYYKGKSVKVQNVGRDLGVRYVLEGSVQRSGDKLHISAQLVESASGHHVWAEIYDRGAEDLFAVQKEITRNIVSVIGSSVLLKAEIDRLIRAPTKNLEAYDYYLRGELHHARDTKEDNLSARRFYEKAVQVDPDYTLAVAGISNCYLAEIWGNWFVSREQSLQQAERHALRAIELDEAEPWGYQALGYFYQFQGEIEQAIAMWEKAYDLNPNDFFTMNGLGYDLAYTGDPQKGLPMMEEAIRVNPYCGERQLRGLGQVYFLARRYQDAVDTLRKITRRHRPSFWLYLAASYAQLGRMGDAHAAIAQALKLEPELSLNHEIKRREKNGLSAENSIHLREALVKAGLPK
jgi:adenylate cyclase